MEENKTTKLSSLYFNNLNGLRFIGALSVFLFHCFTLGREMWGEFFELPAVTILTKVMSKGHHGVGLFFVLSGFLITYLLLHEAKKNGGINVFGFFMRRLLRIWPLYFIVVLFGFFVFPHIRFGSHTTNSLTHYLVFLSNFEEIWNGWRDSVNFLSVTWSVSIEEQFYMSWVVLMAIFPFMRKGRLFLPYLVIILLVSIGFRILNYEDERTIYFHTFSVMSDLSIGGILGWLVFHYKIPDRILNLKRIYILLIYLIGVSVILFSNQLFPEVLVAFERLIIGLFFGFIIFEQVHCNHSLFKADSIPFFKGLGEISYGFYMYHCIIIFFTQELLKNHSFGHGPIGFSIFILMSFVGTYILSRWSYTYIEKPILSFKKFFR